MKTDLSSNFPFLPVLEALRQDYIFSSRYEEILLIGVQHLNETTGSLICTLLSLGFEPDSVLLLGKNYSSNPLTINKLNEMGCDVSTVPFDTAIGEFGKSNEIEISTLWEKVQRRLGHKKYTSILVIDDGGRFISSAPESIRKNYKIASVEQTTKGIKNQFVIDASFPVISVASSRLKKETESLVIAQGIADSLERINFINKQIGIIGLGSIGNALRNHFNQMGFILNLFDHEQKAINNCSSIEELIRNSDIVFGCTGTSLEFDLDCLDMKETVLASCSSEDIEFKKILANFKNPSFVKNDNTSCDLIYKFKTGQVSLLNSGYPINFRNDRELEPEHKIQLTRALILGGIIQAVDHLQSNTLSPGLNCLSEEIEMKIEKYLLKFKPLNELAI